MVSGDQSTRTRRRKHGQTLQDQPARPQGRGIFYVGQTADNVLGCMKASKRKPTQQAEQIGEDQHGLVVKWHLPDYILTLARRQKKYRVIKVEQILIPG